MTCTTSSGKRVHRSSPALWITLMLTSGWFKLRRSSRSWPAECAICCLHVPQCQGDIVSEPSSLLMSWLRMTWHGPLSRWHSTSSYQTTCGSKRWRSSNNSHRGTWSYNSTRSSSHSCHASFRSRWPQMPNGYGALLADCTPRFIRMLRASIYRRSKTWKRPFWFEDCAFHIKAEEAKAKEGHLGTKRPNPAPQHMQQQQLKKPKNPVK